MPSIDGLPLSLRWGMVKAVCGFAMLFLSLYTAAAIGPELSVIQGAICALISVPTIFAGCYGVLEVFGAIMRHFFAKRQDQGFRSRSRA
jgi:hypothetical protein